MIYIENKNSNPFYNHAFEEFVFLNVLKDEEILLLWTSRPCVVCGKFQNIFEEVNLARAKKNRVAIIRRNSGGGTVYHDYGNLNYTLMRKRSEDESLDYDSFLNPVVDALHRTGVPAIRRGVSDIAIGDKKISGNAESVKADRIMHHGTLLFDTKLDNLSGILKVPEVEFQSKAVKSVHSEVCNIKDYIENSKMKKIADFKEALKNAFGPRKEIRLKENDILQIEEIAETKYKSWEWTYGHNPKFSCKYGETEFEVSGGIIVSSDDERILGIKADKFFANGDM